MTQTLEHSNSLALKLRSWLVDGYHNFGAPLALLVLLVGLLLLSHPVHAQQPNQYVRTLSANSTTHNIEIHFGLPTIRSVVRNGQACTKVSYIGAQQYDHPAQPSLPFHRHPIVLPAGKHFSSYNIHNEERVTVQLNDPLCVQDNHSIEHHFNKDERVTAVQTHPVAAGRFDGPFPLNQLEFTRFQRSHGEELVLSFFPIQALSSHSIAVNKRLRLRLYWSDIGNNIAAQLRGGAAKVGSYGSVPSIKARFNYAGGLAALAGSNLSAIPAGTDPEDIQVWRDGVQIPAEVSSSGASISSVRFFLPDIEESVTIYDDEHVVWVTWNGGPELDVNSVNGDPTGKTLQPDLYRHTQTIRQFQRHWFSWPLHDGQDSDGFYIAPHPYKSLIYWALHYTSPGVASAWSTNFTPETGYIANNNVSLRAIFRGLSFYVQNPDHRTQVLLNGNLIATEEFDDQTLIDTTYNTSLALSASNTISLNIPGTMLSSGFESVAIYGFKVTYDRQLQAINDYLAFDATSTGAFAVSNFSSNDISVYRYDLDGTLSKLNNVQITQNPDTTYKATFGTTVTGHFIALTESAAIDPESAEEDTPSSLRTIGQGAEYVVVAGKGLKESAQELADLRSELNGLSTLVVDVVDIYDEYNNGNVDPMAIRTFLKEANTNWQVRPKYLVLVGDANEDQLGLLDQDNAAQNLLPSVYDVTLYVQIQNDNLFGTFTNSVVSDIFVGRIPADSNAEVRDYIAKVNAYENAPNGAWQDEMGILIDNVTQPWETPFSESAQDMMDMATANNRTVTDFISLDATTAADATSRLHALFNTGLYFIYFTGHSATDFSTVERVLEIDDFGDTIQPIDYAFPIAAWMTCLTGNFFAYYSDALMERAVLAPSMGPIMAFASSGLTWPQPQAVFAEVFYEQLLQRGEESIGEVMQNVREHIWSVLNVHQDVLNTYSYLGDPALGAARLGSGGTSPGASSNSSNTSNGCGAIYLVDHEASTIWTLPILFSLLIIFWLYGRHEALRASILHNEAIQRHLTKKR